MNPAVATFRAPWSRSLRATTWMASTALLLAAALVLFLPMRANWRLLAALPLLTLIGCVLCQIRGYVLRADCIEILRPGWRTRLPLQGLKSVGGSGDAFTRAWRLFGNGGLFSISGWFWSRQVGLMRVYATDTQRAVMLKYARRIVILTPHDPQQFVLRVRKLLEH